MPNFDDKDLVIIGVIFLSACALFISKDTTILRDAYLVLGSLAVGTKFNKI